MADSYTTAAALREEILSSASGARGFIAGLFDEGTFLETGTYIRNAGDDRNFEGVITGENSKVRSWIFPKFLIFKRLIIIFYLSPACLQQCLKPVI